MELQRLAQPNSWDVSIEESMMKENPLTPPDIAFNSGLPPYPSNGGLWNCRKLKVGSSYCQADTKEYMIAQHFPDEPNGEITGQVAVFGGEGHLLVASCKESSGVFIEIHTRQFPNSQSQSDELEIAFDNEPFATYQFTSVNKSTKVITDTKLLFAELMKDSTLLKIRTASANTASTNYRQFVVRNFPKAWPVACGWHVEYDSITGIK